MSNTITKSVDYPECKCEDASCPTCIKVYTDTKLQEMATIFANMGTGNTKAEYDEAYAKERMIIQLIAAKNPALGELLGAI
tara:strand:- start:63 stop:305 length:243 start_codon:yes stop_codon:yes gene_type:complete